MERDFDGEIMEIDGQIEESINNMEMTCKEFIRYLKTFVKDYYAETIREIVSLQHEHTKKLDQKEIRHLKEECQSLIENISEKIDKKFNEDTYWIHRQKIPENYDPGDLSYKKSGKQYFRLHKEVSTLETYSKNLIVKYGYSDLNYNSNYSLNNWTYDLSRTLKEYSEFNEERLELINKKNKIIDEKGQFEAENLWDNV